MHQPPRTRRRWVIAPPTSRRARSVSRYVERNTSPSDDGDLAVLLDAAYDGSIDHDPEADHLGELRTWRSVDGADDAASFVAIDGSSLIGASLIGRELGTPLLYEIAVLPGHRSQGAATQLLSASISRLRDEPMVAAWVTHGNEASEALLRSAGFWPSTRPLGRPEGLAIFAAASIIEAVDPPAGAVLWAGTGEGGPELWVIGEDGTSETFEGRRGPVTVHRVSPGDRRVTLAAATTTPLSGAQLHRSLIAW